MLWKLRVREMKPIALYIVVAPIVILAGTGLAAALPEGRASIGIPSHVARLRSCRPSSAPPMATEALLPSDRWPKV